MPTVTVFVGIPGSGKSTEIINLIDKNTFVYSTDDYIEVAALFQGKTYNDVFESTIKEANSVMNSALETALKDGNDVIWDQTNLGANKRMSILSRFPKHYTKKCVCFLPPKNPEEFAELDRRLNSRIGKTIPKYILNSMISNYTEPTYDEGFDDVKFISNFS